MLFLKFTYKMKQLKTFLKNYLPLFIAITLPALFVLIIKYENIHYTFLTEKIYKEGVTLFLSLITLSTLFLVFYQWRKDNKAQKLTDINLLFEELRHNINILNSIFVTYDRKIFYSFIANQLLTLAPRGIYPNPTDSDEQKKNLFNYVKRTDNFKKSNNIFSPRNNYIQNAITSKNIFNLNNQRIFLNLGHLDYSIKRHNYNIEQYNQLTGNDKSNKYEVIQFEYIMWLHFRLHFMFVDLIINTPKSYFVDRDFINIIKEEIDNPKQN